jgi:ABC-2 type transport system permease protein
MNVSLFRVHAATMLRELVRTPAFAVPTVLFPAMFYVIFALQYARTSSTAANAILAAYVAFAVVGVTLFQFGVGIATERGRPWERYQRTLPVSIETRFLARIAVATIFGLAAAGLVAAIAALFSPLSLNAGEWILLVASAALGAMPFVMIGVAIAYWVPPRGAQPITSALYLLMSFAGGLWIPPQDLPAFAAGISPWLPTRQFGELLWSATGTAHDGLQAALFLGIYTLVFSAIAIAGYRRDERTRYA